MNYQAKNKEVISIEVQMIALARKKTAIRTELLKESLDEAFRRFPQFDKITIVSDEDSVEVYLVTDKLKMQLGDPVGDLYLSLDGEESLEEEDINQEDLAIVQGIEHILSQGNWGLVSDDLGTTFNMELEDFSNYYKFKGQITRGQFFAADADFKIEYK